MHNNNYQGINIEFCFMQRHVILTKDGSHTIAVPGMDVAYHSIHGAVQESQHVFIHAGLHPLINQSANNLITILEMGFGTGLNALLTLLEADKMKQPVYYTAIELYPLKKEETGSLNYCELLNRTHHQVLFEKLHSCEWEKSHPITPFFSLYKNNCNLINFSTTQLFNLIYFDAFAPTAQPELWTKEIFEKLYTMLLPGGILVTYCSKGDVRRNMQSAGFSIEKIPGPPGKREMIRAVRKT
jgi:tRNA U34 5-methylaminomethyl-2-thiouridine-forming methyltransferase MnmC